MGRRFEYGKAEDSSGLADGKTPRRFTEVTSSADESVRRAFGYLDEVMGTNPPGKCSLNVLRCEFGVLACGYGRFIQGKSACGVGDQIVRDTVNARFRKGNLLEEQDLGLRQRLLGHQIRLHSRPVALPNPPPLRRTRPITAPGSTNEVPRRPG